MLGFLIILAFPQSYSSPYSIIRITDNEFDDKNPQINDSNDVVWQGDDGNDFEIYMYEWLIDWVWQYTDNSVDDKYPKINDNGDIAWQQDDGTHMKILFYEKAEDTIWEIVTGDRDTSWNTLEPFMNNNGDIVWHENTGVSYNIFLYDNSTGNILQLTSDVSVNNYNPKINDNREIVWFRYFSDPETGRDRYSIVYYDTNLGYAQYIWTLQTIIGALQTNVERHEPLICSNGNAIWSFYDVGLSDTEIFYFDREAGSVLQLTDNSDYDVIPDINSNGDAIWRLQAEYNDIILYTHSTGETRKISDSENHAYWGPTMGRISDSGHVTFQAVEARIVSWNNEVYVWDGSEVTNISQSDYNEYYPMINGLGNVVWAVDTDNEDDEIFIAYLPEEEGDEGENGNGESGTIDCFIATACYGTPMAEEVKILRDFRDQYLMASPMGKAFVRAYNKYGPKAAEFTRDKESLKKIIRLCLKPILRLIKHWY